ncbi:Rv1733c family protein, partial [Streptomyces sparsus]
MFRAIVGLWRWRHNPLRRRSDRVETWLALGAALVITLGAPLVGIAAGDAAHGSLLRTVAAEHEQRQQVWATVHRLLPRPAAEPEFEEFGDRSGRQRVVVGWTAPDGTVRTATLGTREGTRVGERF